MARHTSGPFSTIVEDAKHGHRWNPLESSNSFAIHEPHGHLIARVCATSLYSPEDRHGEKMAKANLALFLSAPDLLAALEGAKALVLQMGTIIRSLDSDNAKTDLWTNDGDPAGRAGGLYVPDTRFEDIEDAIAKATGGA